MKDSTKVTSTSIRMACKKVLEEKSISPSFTMKFMRVCSFKETEKKTSISPICDPFEPLGRTFDENGENTALVIRFAANRKTKDIVEVTVPMADLVTDARKVVAVLASKGLWVSASREAVGQVGRLLSLIQPENDVVTVSRPGWYDDVFVSPTGEVFGSSKTVYRLSDATQFADPEKSGTLEEWCNSTRAALDSANGDFLCMGLLSGFAGTLVNLMQEPTSLLINFAGTTSRGKTTAQRLGASVWGNPIRGASLLQFNMTPNVVEAVAEKANASLLAIDEGGQSGMTGPQYQMAVFNLAGGSGKHRLKPDASERNVRRWSTCITISEEIGFADKVKRDGRSPAAGAVARIWEIDVDDAEILDDETISEIKGVEKHYGHAAPVFVQHLFDNGYTRDVEQLKKQVRKAELQLSAEGDAPQKRRVAGAAAILLVAGQIAQKAGLIRAEFDLLGAVRRVLERSYARMARDMDPIESALQSLREGVLGRLGYDIRDLDYEQDHVHREVNGYYGYVTKPNQFTGDDKDFTADERVYFIPVEQLVALGGGNVAAKAIARALNKHGYLLTPNEKNSLYPTMPKGEKIQHYRIRGTFFHEVQQAESKVAAE